jgi:transposase
VVRDRYAAYNGIGTDWQSCLAHISSKAKEIGKEHALLPPPEQECRVESFCANVRDFCKRACEVGQLLDSGKTPWMEAGAIEKRFVDELNKICKHQLNFKSAETLRKSLAGPEQKSLLTFLRIPGVPPTNNLAEQAQRHMVIFRKLSFGTRSDSGIETHSILPSLVQTARRQGVDPREFLHILLTADAETAKAALYNNSS